MALQIPVADKVSATQYITEEKSMLFSLKSMKRLRFPYMETVVSCLGNCSVPLWKLQFPAWEL